MKTLLLAVFVALLAEAAPHNLTPRAGEPTPIHSTCPEPKNLFFLSACRIIPAYQRLRQIENSR